MLGELVAVASNHVFVDRILIDERWRWIRPMLLILGLSAAYRLMAGAVQYTTLRRLRKALSATHSARFFWHVLRLPTLFYQQRFAGDVSSRVDGNSQVADLVTGQLATALVGLLMVVFYGAVMFTLDPPLAVLGMVIGALNLAAIAAATRILTEENFKV
jgi:ABC-type bacteriocin/lantibiotic exporter with double-glycine peptidase domain